MTDYSYLQMALALILVIGLIVALGFVAKKKQGPEGLMKIVGYQSLGQKKGIAAVKIGQEVLLVAVTATDLKLLKTFDYAEDENVRNKPSQQTSVAAAADNLMKLKALKDTLHAVK